MKEPGKIDQSFFEHNILQYCGFNRNEVITGPGFGIDVSVVDLHHNMAMALTSDPLSLIPSLGLEESAWLSVHLMANDMATTGFQPMYGQFVLNLPEYFSNEDFSVYWNHIHCFCKSIGVAITGGHTGFIQNQHSTIAGGGTFITVAPKDQILTSNKARPGNILIATKQCGLTAVSILAKSFPNTVQQKLGKEVYDKACDLFHQTSSLKDALTAKGNAENIGEVTAMHDVTEGGILGAAYELAVASGNGLLLYNNAIPVGDVQQAIAQLFSLDPRYIVGAGSMLICATEGSEQNVLNRLKAENIEAAIIGKLVKKEEGLKIIEDDELKNIVYLEKDPYWNAFFDAYKRGWN